MKYIGNGLCKTKNRIYKRENGKWKVVSWIDKRCKLCGKFIKSKGQHTGVNRNKYCKKCYEKQRMLWTRGHQMFDNVKNFLILHSVELLIKDEVKKKHIKRKRLSKMLSLNYNRFNKGEFISQFM